MSDHDNHRLFEEFIAFSAVVTAFSAFKLHGTGQAALYFSTVAGIVGEEALGELTQAFRRCREEAGRDEAAMEDRLRAAIFSHDRLGSIARNIVKLWYAGTWYQLPLDWREAYGVSEKDSTHVVSPNAYPEGLLWPAIGANPSGAKGPGYGTWGEPPTVGEL